MLNTIEIEESLETLVGDVADRTCTLHDFPFRLMEAYSASRNEIAKLRMKHSPGLMAADLVWPKKLIYRAADRGQVQSTIETLKASLIGKNGKVAKSVPRFLMSTDGDEFLSVDLKTGETPAFDRLADLPVNYDFLLPMFGVERYQPAPETVADVRAARHMAKFHDAIRDANPDWGDDRVHDLNLFMTRLLFCMFAEDTGIFPDKLFLETLRREAVDVGGSDTKRVIEDIFLALDIADKVTRRAKGVRSQRIAADFPYVNGGLFRDHTEVPNFNRRARRLLLEAAGLHWDQIHADIFGSMIQAIVQTDMRADFGMHYTSVPNIMKVLDPLFLNSLREQLTSAGDNVKALEKLIDRISRIRVFDPACGSGNFLIIAYRELRIIETEAFRRIRDVKRKGQLALADFQTGIKISNFYGIDPVDFACETAKLSLWISQYQMNKKLDEICSAPTPALPLTDAGHIVVGNALRKDWADVCPPRSDSEVFIVGNPPYLGSNLQDDEQKEDVSIVFRNHTKSFKKLDYVAAWYAKAAQYNQISGGQAAFVATNSICQGEQVCILWPIIYSFGQEIIFAYTSFKWKNNATNNAAVICVIVGIGAQGSRPAKIFYEDRSFPADSINPYLANAPTVIVFPRSSSTSLPQMSFGNQFLDGGNMIFSEEQRAELFDKYPQSEKYFRQILGSKELIQGDVRYCLWITNKDIEEVQLIPPICERLERVRIFRASSPRQGTNQFANSPHLFPLTSSPPQEALVIPRVSSERRLYIPSGFATDRHIVPDSAFAVLKAPTWLFSIISSRMHSAWTGVVGGRLKSDFRYSNTLVYNTFPVPDLSQEQLSCLEGRALSVLGAREPYFTDGRNLAWLYNPETMPSDLLQAHHELDDYLETIYIGRPFKDDAERLEHLFKLYARMTKTAAKAA
jgi:hypothetical protein